MDNSTIVLFVISGLQGIAMYFMKQANEAQRDRITKQEIGLEKLRDEAHKKEDFREFKDELWRKLDDMKKDFKEALDKK